MIPSQWITILSAGLTVVLAGLGFYDTIYHTSLLTNPLTLSILAFLGALGIHQTVSTNTTIKETMVKKP